MRTYLTTILLATTFVGSTQINYDKDQVLEKNQSMAGAYSPNGKYLAAGSGKYINVFLSGSEYSTRLIETDFNVVDGVSFVNETSALVTGMNRSLISLPRVTLVNIETGVLEKELNLGDQYKGAKDIVYLDRWGSFLILDKDGKAIVWDDSTGHKKIEHLSAFTDAKFLSKSGMIYLCDEDGGVFNYDVIKAELNELKKIPGVSLQYIDVSRNEESIAVADKKKGLYLLHREKGYVPIPLTGSEEKSDYIEPVFSYDDQYLATLNRFSFQIWNRENNNLITEKLIKRKGILSNVYFDPQGKFLNVVGFNSKEMELWNCLGLNIKPYLEYKDETDKTPPQVVLTNPKVPKDRVSVTKEEIKLQGMVIDNVGVLEVKVNGQEASLTATGDFEMKLKLAIGENLVSIEATDVNNNTAVKKVKVIRKEFDLESLSFESKNHLLMISIDKYQHWPPLNNAVYDANHFSEVLIDKYGFDSANVIRVRDTTADRQGIIDGFKKLITSVGPNDNVIVYYSGHGFFDAELGEGYWIPYDAQEGQDGDYLPNSFMMQLMKKVNSKHLFLVADACFSGSLFSESHRGYTENVGSYKSRWGLASGRLEYVSDGTAGEHSPFNKYLVQYLEENEQEEFSVSELVQYVKMQVANETDQAPIGNPLQGLGDEGGEFIFKVDDED